MTNQEAAILMVIGLVIWVAWGALHEWERKRHWKRSQYIKSPEEQDDE